LLYSLDEHIDADFWVKAVGHQWYWTYEYPMFENSKGRWVVFDSSPVSHIDPVFFDMPILYPSPERFTMLSKIQTNPDISTKYISVDNPLILPTNYQIQVLISSSDVLHSWAAPSLGVKMDACPGRLNKVSFKIEFQTIASNMHSYGSLITNALPFSTGIWGQCSEFCGVGHGFMPIVIHSVKDKYFFMFFDVFMFKLHLRKSLFSSYFTGSSYHMSDYFNIIGLHLLQKYNTVFFTGYFERYLNNVFPSTVDYTEEFFGWYDNSLSSLMENAD
jgi:hypothetical protein